MGPEPDEVRTLEARSKATKNKPLSLTPHGAPWDRKLLWKKRRWLPALPNVLRLEKARTKNVCETVTREKQRVLVQVAAALAGPRLHRHYFRYCFDL